MLYLGVKEQLASVFKCSANHKFHEGGWYKHVPREASFDPFTWLCVYIYICSIYVSFVSSNV